MSLDLRCRAKKHGELLETAPDGIVEVQCNSRWCGAHSGVVVLHQFSTETAELIQTKTFKNPERK